MRRTSKRPIRRNPDGTREHPTVIEKIDDVDAFLAAPGHYQTTSTFPAYAVAKALDGWHPLFKGGMDMPFVEGNIFFFQVLSEPERQALPGAVPEGEILDDTDHSLRENPLVAMGVSPDFWSKLLQRYRNWELAWWREIAQNSRDAAATQMDWSVAPGKYKDIETGVEVDAMVVTAYDNGGGMDADVLRRALLTRGGSVKPEAAVGGFGDAKNLILFPWLGWKVETRDLVAFGQHESVMEPPGIHQAPSPIQGTRITAWMPLTQTTADTYAQQLLGRSYLPGVRVRVNGKSVAADLIGGEEVAKTEVADERGRSVGEIVAHHHHNARANKGLYIRARGVYMFEDYANDIPGVVYVDVNAPAKLVFDASRNSLIGPARTFVERLKERLAKEPEAVLRSKKWKAEKIYRGTGAIEVREGRAAEVAAKAVAKIADQLAKRQAQKKSPTAADAKVLAEEAAKAIEDNAAASPPVTTEEEVAQRMMSSRETATRLITHSATQATTTEQIATAVRYAMWEPDLFMANQMPFWKPPAALEPETMEAKYIILLRAWTEACKFGLNALGEFRPFGVGFIMMLDGINKLPVLGAYQRHEGTDWLMINPLKFERGRYDYEAHEHVWTASTDRLDLSTDDGVEELCSTAIHEITHLQGFGDHDSGFASQLTWNMKAAHRGMFGLVKDQLKAIRSETRARFAEIRQEKAAAKSVPWDVVVGRVTAILEWWDGLFSSGQRDLNSGSYDIENLAREAGRNERSIKESVVSLLGSFSSRRELLLKPKLIVKLHDEALAAGAFKLITEDEAKKLVQVWQSVPADPRVRQSLSAPEGVLVFSWTRSGKDWVLREGFVGQRGAEVMRYEGSMSTWDRRRQRDESVSAISSYLTQAKRSWPGSENIYVWLMTSGSEWLLRVKEGGQGVVDTEDADYAIKVEGPNFEGLYVAYMSGFPGTGSKVGFSSVAEAQKYALDGVVRQRAGG